MCRFLTLIAAVSLTASVAWSQVVVSPGISYMSQKVDQTQPTAVSGESSELRADLRLGYILPMGLYLGAMYSHIDYNNGDAYQLGPSVGYFSTTTGFYGLLTYHIMGQAGSNPQFSGAQGPQVDVGWIFPVTRYFSIGPQITWRSTEFDERTVGGVTQSSDRQTESIAPYVSLWFMF